ncbi:Hypothetical predicted protein [Podarcis lilfordi]|uniref:Uncharacterized protein n=1 Tax=Podarcis lilfordi TaxID=74358 RepID=A0AA35KKA4_9SAUR|nr:Hypothetical predicted protein [Podarcis lilfordi]
MWLVIPGFPPPPSPLLQSFLILFWAISSRKHLFTQTVVKNVPIGLNKREMEILKFLTVISLGHLFFLTIQMVPLTRQSIHPHSTVSFPFMRREFMSVVFNSKNVAALIDCIEVFCTSCS